MKESNLTLEECMLILENIQGLIVVDKNGKVKYLSPDMEERLLEVGNYSDNEGYLDENILKIHPKTKILEALKNNREEIVFYIISGLPNIARIKPLYQNGTIVGAMDYDLLASKDWQEFMSIIGRASAGGGLSLLEDINALMKREKEKNGKKYNINSIIGNSKRMQMLKQQIHNVAASDAAVLIQGETGSGKELIASSIHHLSRRAHGKFIEVNCAAIPETLIESELFGYDKGSFTGAKKEGSKGLFERADKGTLFLDEIDQLPYYAQPKLLRVLQEQEVDRIGGTKVSVDVRVVAATNKNLKEMVEKGQFREDLYYRLNVINLKAPPLREHKEDIPILVENYLAKLNKAAGQNKSMDDSVYDLLYKYHWPGNVREFFNLLERAFAMAKGDKIKVSDYDELYYSVVKSRKSASGRTLQKIREDAEREAIIEAMELCRSNKSRAAEQLGITRANLYHKIEKYGIE